MGAERCDYCVLKHEGSSQIVLRVRTFLLCKNALFSVDAGLSVLVYRVLPDQPGNSWVFSTFTAFSAQAGAMVLKTRYFHTLCVL